MLNREQDNERRRSSFWLLTWFGFVSRRQDDFNEHKSLSTKREENLFASRWVNHNGSESYQLSEWQIMASGIVIHQQLHSSFACRFIRTHVLGLEPYLVGGRRWLVWNSAAGEVSAEFQPIWWIPCSGGRPAEKNQPENSVIGWDIWLGEWPLSIFGRPCPGVVDWNKNWMTAVSSRGC